MLLPRPCETSSSRFPICLNPAQRVMTSKIHHFDRTVLRKRPTSSLDGRPTLYHSAFADRTDAARSQSTQECERAIGEEVVGQQDGSIRRESDGGVWVSIARRRIDGCSIAIAGSAWRKEGRGREGWLDPVCGRLNTGRALPRRSFTAPALRSADPGVRGDLATIATTA